MLWPMAVVFCKSTPLSLPIDVYLDQSAAHISTIDIHNGVLAFTTYEVFFFACQHYLTGPRVTVLDHSSQIWWRWMNIFFTLIIWSVELIVSADDDIPEKDWKID